jgi:hypothetical protein
VSILNIYRFGLILKSKEMGFFWGGGGGGIVFCKKFSTFFFAFVATLALS